MKRHYALIAILIFASAYPASAAEYAIKVVKKGYLSESLNLSGESSIKIDIPLLRQHIIINDKSCPVTINNAYSLVIRDANSGLASIIECKQKEKVVAVRLRMVLFNVFGEHMVTLHGTEYVKSSTDFRLNSSWFNLNDTILDEFLNTFVYIDRVRLADGTIWKADPIGVKKHLIDSKESSEMGITLTDKEFLNDSIGNK